MSARRKKVISTDEIQFVHKPAKMLLIEKRRESAKMAKPQVWLGSAHIAYQIGQYLSDVKHCYIQSWPCGGLSSWPMVPITTNLTAPPTPIQDGRWNQKIHTPTPQWTWKSPPLLLVKCLHMSIQLSCVKFRPDGTIRIKFRAKHNFHNISIMIW